eukprot:5973996-Prymnesium_polylepis.1
MRAVGGVCSRARLVRARAGALRRQRSPPPSQDEELAAHYDNSEVTLNVNLGRDFLAGEVKRGRRGSSVEGAGGRRVEGAQSARAVAEEREGAHAASHRLRRQ